MVYFRSQVLECPSIGGHWNIAGVPVLPENVIVTFLIESASVVQKLTGLYVQSITAMDTVQSTPFDPSCTPP